MCLSLDVDVGVGTAAQAEAEKDEAATDHQQTHEDVDQRGGPESKQVQGLVAVRIHGGCVLVVVGLVNRVDPHVTWK